MKLKRREQAIAEEIANAPAQSRGIVERALSGTGSRPNALKATCLTCTHFDRQEIKGCTVYRCPLWAYRPYRK